MRRLGVICCEFSELFICEACVYRVRKVEALGGRKEEKEAAIKSPSMAYTDLDSGPPSLYCSCLKEKHHLWLPGVKFSSSKSFILSCFSARGGVSVHTLAS